MGIERPSRSNFRATRVSPSRRQASASVRPGRSAVALGRFERDLIRTRATAVAPVAATPGPGVPSDRPGLTVSETAARLEVGKSARYAALEAGGAANAADE